VASKDSLGQRANAGFRAIRATLGQLVQIQPCRDRLGRKELLVPKASQERQ
jgi:hypothetical protein